MPLLAFLWLTAVMAPGQQSAEPPPPPSDCSAPEHRQFDFWLGDWDVAPYNATPPPAEPVGRNTITLAHDACVLLENWRADSMTGQSVNIYDRSRGQWHQTWVDSRGGLHDYWGAREDDRMVFHGTMPLPSSPAFRMHVRLTFFDLADGRVRQLSERLNADGTWSVNYDLLYTNRTP